MRRTELNLKDLFSFHINFAEQTRIDASGINLHMPNTNKCVPAALFLNAKFF